MSRNIIIGIVVLVVVFTYPFWNAAIGSPETPEILIPYEQQTIGEADFKRTNHMEILTDWKTAVVRDGDRIYMSDSGKAYSMSLQNSCLECHSVEQFCDACHNFADVNLNCWTCHVP